MVLHPTVYARFLGEKIARHDSRVWLVNTGWTGGPYGIGSRMKIAHTRAMIRAALSGLLDSVSYETDPIFNLDVPQACPGVPAEVLRPRATWKNPAEYDAQAHKLANMFVDNFRSFEAEASHDIKAAGPRASSHHWPLNQ
jgi:phosphoenolpyruvate carboxykinase (ATP)